MSFEKIWLLRILTLASLTMAVTGVHSEEIIMSEKAFARVLYGFDSEMAPFRGLTPEGIAEKLRDWGCNAVFVHGEPDELLRVLRDGGIRCFTSVGLFQGKRYWQSHPESRPVEADGSLLKQDRWYCGVCPNQHWLREQKLEGIRKIAAQGKVDGIWLDCIRYPVHWEVENPYLPETCFCPVCVRTFAEDTGAARLEGLSGREASEIVLKDHEDEWYKWRAKQITDFVGEVEETIREQDPDCQLGIFSVPWLEGERDNAIIKVVAQDFSALAEHVDVFSPMVYHLMCVEPESWAATVTAKMNRQTGKPIWPIVQACSEPSALTKEGFMNVLEYAEKEPSSGVIVFHLKAVLEEDKLETLKEAWGKSGSKKNEQ